MQHFKNKYADHINTKYAVEIWYELRQTNYPIVSQGSGQMDGAILLAIRYDTRCYFNVRSKADISQLDLPHGTDN